MRLLVRVIILCKRNIILLFMQMILVIKIFIMIYINVFNNVNNNFILNVSSLIHTLKRLINSIGKILYKLIYIKSWNLVLIQIKCSSGWSISILLIRIHVGREHLSKNTIDVYSWRYLSILICILIWILLIGRRGWLSSRLGLFLCM